MEVNGVLAELVDVMQKKTGRVSPLMFILDWVGQRSDEKLINFSMVKARDHAWRLAQEIATLTGKEKRERIDKADRTVARLSNILINPPGRILNPVMLMLGMFETKSVRKIIEKLSRS